MTKQYTQRVRVAALTATVLGGAMLLIACGSEADVAAEPASTTATPAPSSTTTTTANIEPTTTVDPDEAWDAIPGWSSDNSGVGSAYFFGEVRTISFSPELTFVAPEGAGKQCPNASDFIDFVPPAAVDRPESDAQLNLIRRGESTVDATAQAIATLMDLPADFAPITIGGAVGVTFGGDTSEDEGDTLFISRSGACTLTLNSAESWHFWIVDVQGDIVTFALYATKEGFGLNMPAIEDVLDSVVWRDLS
jgi:hypothetical protein